MRKNLVIAYSQQRKNLCKCGDVEQDHMFIIANYLYNIMIMDSRFNCYIIPKLPAAPDGVENLKTDNARLTKSINMSNEFIRVNGNVGYHLELHSDSGGYKKGCSGLYLSEKGKNFLLPIIKELADLTPFKDGNLLYYRNDLSALKRTTAVAGVIEVSFHDTIEGAKWIHENMNSIAVRLANGIYKSLGRE